MGVQFHSHAHAHWAAPIKMELWTFAVRYVADQWNNTPHKQLEYQTPNQIFVKNQPHSLVILVILLPRPRNPSNGELAARILRMASYPVSEMLRYIYKSIENAFKVSNIKNTISSRKTPLSI